MTIATASGNHGTGCTRRRTGLEIFGGGHKSARLAPKARVPLGGGGLGTCSPGNFKK